KRSRRRRRSGSASSPSPDPGYAAAALTRHRRSTEATLVWLFSTRARKACSDSSALPADRRTKLQPARLRAEFPRDLAKRALGICPLVLVLRDDNRGVLWSLVKDDPDGQFSVKCPVPELGRFYGIIIRMFWEAGRATSHAPLP